MSDSRCGRIPDIRLFSYPLKLFLEKNTFLPFSQTDTLPVLKKKFERLHICVFQQNKVFIKTHCIFGLLSNLIDNRSPDCRIRPDTEYKKPIFGASLVLSRNYGTLRQIEPQNSRKGVTTLSVAEPVRF